MWQKLYKIFRSSFGVISVITLIVLWSAISYFGISYGKEFFSNITSNDYADTSETGSSSDMENCNVLGINLHGQLLTYIPIDTGDSLIKDTDLVSSDTVLYYINQAEKDDEIKAILVEVDSYGGSPVAGEEVSIAIKTSTKPTVGLIRQAGISAAYLAISSAGRIFASKNSDVGGIGVTQSYLDNVSKNQKEGYNFVQLNAGKYKDIGNPDKPLTEEERVLLIRDLNIVYQNFIKDVSVNRGIPLEDVKKIADGSSVMGETAKALHLIDEIGSITEVEKYLSEKIGEEVEICWN